MSDPNEGAIPMEEVPEGSLGGGGIKPEFQNFDRMEFDSKKLVPSPLKMLRVVDALIHYPGAVYRGVLQEKDVTNFTAAILMTSLAIFALYGAIMGFFAGGVQIVFAAVKMPLIIVGALLVCLPTFYVFNSLSGSRLSVSQVFLALLVFAGFLSIFLIGFAPIVWFFGLTSGTEAFMAWLHIAVLAASFALASKSFHLFFSYLGFKAGAEFSASKHFITAWQVIFVIVACQLAFYFKPLMISGPFHTGERGIFLSAIVPLLRGY